MGSVLPFLIPLALLACPLMMVGMGVGAWVFARARGEKKPLSMGCMGGHCEHEEHRQNDPNLKEQVTQLEQQVHVLKAQLGTSGNGTVPGDGLITAKSEEELPANR